MGQTFFPKYVVGKYVGKIRRLAKLLDLQNLARRKKAIKTTKDHGNYIRMYYVHMYPFGPLTKGGFPTDDVRLVVNIGWDRDYC